jgi:Uma2 family endonuclease
MTAMRKPESPAMTYAEYCLLPDDGKRYQVIEGELIVSPAPRTSHQRIVLRLAMLLEPYVDMHSLGAIYIAPTDVVLAPSTVVQPDIAFVRSDHLDAITDLNIQGPPDLCIEVLSPGTEATDRERKRALYARYGVPEYWIVDPVRRSVSLFVREGERYTLAREAFEDDEVTSALLVGFRANVRAIFAP